MSLLAEEIVEEWLNRQGYFTIRGVKLGVHELDLLALRPSKAGLDCRHIEVQASVRPISYVTDLPRAVQKATGRKPKSAKIRSEDELRQGVKEWIARKFDDPHKARLRNRLAPGSWSRELVLHVVRHEREVELLVKSGITIHRLKDVVRELKAGHMSIEGAAGSHLLDLVALGAESAVPAQR
jgi:hypothetical protein